MLHVAGSELRKSNSAMKPVLATFATAALLATAKAAFMEYTEDNLKKIYPSIATRTKLDAEFNHEDCSSITFKKEPRQYPDNTVAHLKQTGNKDHEHGLYKHNHFKFEIQGLKTEAMVEYFDMKVYQYDGDIQSVRFYFTLFSYGMDGWIFELPLLQKNQTVQSYDDNVLADWAKNEHVGIKAPVSTEALKNYAENWSTLEGLQVDIFSTLSTLLPYELFERPEPTFMSIEDDPRFDMFAFVTRPLLVDPDYLTACVQFIEAFNKAETSA